MFNFTVILVTAEITHTSSYTLPSFCNYVFVASGYPGVDGEPGDQETVRHTNPEPV